MAEVFFDNPPNLQGKETEQLQQLYAYLNTMSEKLNQALMTITIEQMATETQQMIRYATAEEVNPQIDTVKQLIIKTARIVRTEMDELRSTLTRQITAVSDEYGTLDERLTNEVQLTAEGFQQTFTSIETITKNMGEVATFRNNLNDYIKVGLIKEENGVQTYGVAVGDGLNASMDNMCAMFTKKRLEFYQGNTESPVAYFGNNTFFINSGEVEGKLKIGNHTFTKIGEGALALLAGS